MKRLVLAAAVLAAAVALYRRKAPTLVACQTCGAPTMPGRRCPWADVSVS